MKMKLLLPFLLVVLCFFSCEEEDMMDDNNQTSNNNPTPAYVGEFREGGIVFWVNSSDSLQGLVVTLDDLLATAQWGCYGTSINGAGLTNLYGGATNTSDIVGDCNSVNIAADLCDETVDQGYTDWYLPNTGEWAEIIKHLATLETAAAANSGRAFYDKYWTSNQPNGVVGETLAQAVDIRNNAYTQESKNDRFAVRAVRSFP